MPRTEISWAPRSWLAGFCFLLLASAGPGCGPGEPHATPDSSTVTVLFPGDERSLGPNGSEARFLVFLELATANERGELVGRLARSWTHSEDYRTWTIRLRRDVRWHDGVPVTAHDVKFTIDLWKHPSVQHEAGSRFESATVMDDSTVVVVYERPPTWGGYWLPGYWAVFYPKHLLEGLDPSEFYRWDFWTRPVGNGPYRYVRHVPKTMMELEANPHHYAGVPAIRRVVLKFGPPNITELRAGNVDMISHLRREDIPKLAEDPRYRVYHEIWDDIGFPTVILWNQRHRALRDHRVRRALTLATDRRELSRFREIRGALPGAGEPDRVREIPIIDVPYTERQYWRGELPDPLPHDPEGARALLEEAGWADRDGDGVREREGRKLGFDLLTHPKWRSTAVYVQELFRRVGVEAGIRVADASVVRERTESGDFEAAIRNLWTGPSSLLELLGEDSPLGYRNRRVAALLEAAGRALHPDSVDALYRELGSQLRRDLPWTYLVLDVESYAAHRSIRGLSSPFRANPVWAMEHLWIEEPPATASK